MEYLHLNNRELEWHLNAISNGRFSVELQKLKETYKEGSFTKRVTIYFGTELINLSAEIRICDLILFYWKDDDWNKLSDCPPPQEDSNTLFMVKYKVLDNGLYSYEKQDVVYIKRANDDPNKCSYFSKFSNKEVCYQLQYDVDIEDAVNEIYFKEWK